MQSSVVSWTSLGGAGATRVASEGNGSNLEDLGSSSVAVKRRGKRLEAWIGPLWFVPVQLSQALTMSNQHSQT